MIKSINAKNIVIFSVLLISVILFYILLIFFYYIPNESEISDIYSRSSMIIFLTIIIVIRITISIYATYLLFRIWLTKKNRTYIDLSFTFALFFFFFIPAKLMDLIVYTTYSLYNNYGYSYSLLLNIIKLRYFVLIITILPLFLSGIYLYLFRLNLEKSDFERDYIAKRFTLIFSLIYFAIFFTITTFLSEIRSFSYLGAIITLSSLSFVTWIFFTAYKGKILQEINTLVISIGLVCYLITNAILPILVNIVAATPSEGENLAVSILELGTLFSITVILIGFKKK